MRVIGLDCSTNSFAFAIIEDGTLLHWGEIGYGKGSIMHRARNANRVATEMTNEEYFADIDKVAYEDVVYINNRQTVIRLAMLLSSAVSPFAKSGVETQPVTPLAWQSYIGNKTLTKAEKDKIKEKHPNQSKTWYSNKGREFRKQRTIDWVKDKFGVEIDSDNVSDAIGVAYYAYYN